MRALTATACLALLCATEPAAADPALGRIGHIVVIYEENRSFDNLYGHFPGADGVDKAGAAGRQVDRQGRPYDTLPAVLDTEQRPAIVDPRFPANLPNAPFEAGRYVGLDQMTGDLVHRFYQEQEQIDGGKMDKFAAVSNAGGLTMAIFDGSSLPLYKIAQDYTLADHFFHGAFGGSFLNHVWLICACAPTYPAAPAALIASLDAEGHLLRDGAVTPDFFAVNTIQSVYQPHDARITDPAKLLPPQDAPTIGDRLSDKGIDWAWYAEGYADALAGHPDPLFAFHHQPFVYFRTYGDGTPARAAHLKDGADFMAAIDAGTLPPVAFYKPSGEHDQHPGYASIAAGDHHAAEIITRIQHSKLWPNTVIIVTYDENGGTWDHVAPPKTDIWGPGTRIPTLIIAPFAKRHFVDHTIYDTSSILRLIERRWDLEPLGTRDAKANDLTAALNLK